MTRFLLPLSVTLFLSACGEMKVQRDDNSCSEDCYEDTGANITNTGEDTDEDTGTDEDTDTGIGTDTVYEDLDGDGRTGLIDCDDTDPAIYPGAVETCNGQDDDCDGEVDEEDVCSTVDNDGDGYTPAGGDCDDSNADIHPGAEDEPGDGIDSDCDDETDEDADTGTEEEPAVDSDGDGYTADVDCDDADSTIHPGASDVSDGIDNDCDGFIDEDGDVVTDTTDVDGDGWYQFEDCNDADSTINPDATEVCGDGIDNDCDGSDSVCTEPSVDSDGDGYSEDVDCDDSDATINPGVEERELDDDGLPITGIDEIDNDCDGDIDEDWQAYVLATYGSSGYYQLNVQTYTDADDLGDVWDETDTQSSGTSVDVEFLTSEYDLSSSCGLRLNVSEGNPASDWLCAGGVIDSSVGIDIWFDGDWYDESDLEVWNDGGSCSAVLVVSSDSDCQV
ncbi:hypothetical protein HQ487_03115 [Candidatus Uhrbacteria bacterium]|nr:hypothetical protein [Candidatus Uhrbacteria bacterium]